MPVNRLNTAVKVRILRDFIAQKGGSDAELASEMGMSVAAVKAVANIGEATDEQVVQAAAAMERIGRVIRETMGSQEDTAKTTAVKFGQSAASSRPEIPRDAAGKRIKQPRVPSGDANRDAAGRAIKKVYS